MYVDLKAKPFYLSDKDIQWVEETIASMTLEEKIGQLFILFAENTTEDTVAAIEKYHVGGLRYANEPGAVLRTKNEAYQKAAKVPLLIAANCDSGGDGSMSDGTYVATAAACGASPTLETSYQVGLVSGREAAAIGCTWTYGPVADILYNWRNTIVNTRAYGDDPELVYKNCTEYIRGIRESGMACCAKHFPGDGLEERDQHLVLGLNELFPAEWDNTYGKIYQQLIDDGLQSIMVGHIAMPHYSRKLCPGIKDIDILPATLAPEILQDILRGQLGFNGLIMTDASHMAGMTCQKPRSYQVPGAIAAGCDMFLYFNEYDEDFNYMLEGYKSGLISERRLQEALERIIGFKASIRLHEKQASGTLVPDAAGLGVVGCAGHQQIARAAADNSITLVKNTLSQLPMSPQTHRRILLYFVHSAPTSSVWKSHPVKQVLVEELEAAGYQVSAHNNYFDLEATGHDAANVDKATRIGNMEDYKKNFDAVFYFVFMKGYAQENVVRLSYSTGHAAEIPWMVPELPTVAISLNYTTHLNDLPMMRAFINAYAPTRTVIREVIRKIAGESEFKGICNDIPFCGRWDTRI